MVGHVVQTNLEPLFLQSQHPLEIRLIFTGTPANGWDLSATNRPDRLCGTKPYISKDSIYVAGIVQLLHVSVIKKSKRKLLAFWPLYVHMHHPTSVHFERQNALCESHHLGERTGDFFIIKALPQPLKS